MKILVSIGHPAHVHLFKNLIWNLEDKGHNVKIVARKKDVVLNLLDNYKFKYTLISSKGNGLFNLGFELLRRHISLFKIISEYKPDILLSGFDPSVAQVGYLLNASPVIFTDNRPNLVKFPPTGFFVIPFAETILTLNTVEYDFGSKGIYLNSYKEMAYLHPNYFNPNPNFFNEFNLEQNTEYILLRFVSFGASHDVGISGLNFDTKLKLVHELEKHANVYISSEEPLPDNLAKYHIPVPPEKIHDLIYYAKLLVCDSQTMTTEAGILGTPAIRCNSFVGKNDMGNFIELENKYGLIFNYRDPEKAIKKAIELMKVPNLNAEWELKRKKLLQDKIDLTGFLTWFIENYPESIKASKQKQNIQSV